MEPHLEQPVSEQNHGTVSHVFMIYFYWYLNPGVCIFRAGMGKRTAERCVLGVYICDKKDCTMLYIL